MAHKALYGGTVYKKKGGTELINGTVYKKAYSNNLIGGTVYEVGFAKEYVSLYDFGTIQTPTSAGIGGYYVTQYQVDLSFGFDEPTHMMVNGEIFEVVHSGTDGRHDYDIVGFTGPFVSAEYPYQVFFPQNANGTDYNATFIAFAAGTYTVSLGKYA